MPSICYKLLSFQWQFLSFFGKSTTSDFPPQIPFLHTHTIHTHIYIYTRLFTCFFFRIAHAHTCHAYIYLHPLMSCLLPSSTATTWGIVSRPCWSVSAGKWPRVFWPLGISSWWPLGKRALPVFFSLFCREDLSFLVGGLLRSSSSIKMTSSIILGSVLPFKQGFSGWLGQRFVPCTCTWLEVGGKSMLLFLYR